MIRLGLALILLLFILVKPTEPEMIDTMICPIFTCLVRESRMFNEKTHRGVDIEADLGTPVRAAQGGVVSLSGWSYDADPAWVAKRIIIDHGQGLKTGYWHLDELLVSAGDYVYKGQIIGRSGQTGWASWPHLHFLVIKNGVHQDPGDYIDINVLEG
jgi:murein DD-endopeptidase MepM/ murein hydrolase activator NlpD